MIPDYDEDDTCIHGVPYWDCDQCLLNLFKEDDEKVL